jgi:hypothetical protein
MYERKDIPSLNPEMYKRRLVRGHLPIRERAYWLSKADLELRYTTVRGEYRMAPLFKDELEQSPTVSAFLDGQDPYGCYLISYGPGSQKEPHKDPSNAEGKSKWKHERMVCLLEDCLEGGRLTVEYMGELTEELFVPGDTVQFRADLCTHAVSEVIKGERIVLTVGRLVP